jgi:hypothetical protein
MTKTERAAKAAATVDVRVLPQGDGRIFTGASEPDAAEATQRFSTYRRGETFAIERDVALELEGRGLVEIQP